MTPPPTGISDVGPSTAPPPVLDGEPTELCCCDSWEGAVLAESASPAQAASSGNPAPTSPATAAPRNTVLRSRKVSIARARSFDGSLLMGILQDVEGNS